jgi:putative FmdB family regulatory protein
MPTYEYECDACSHKFEELQSISEKPLKKCPECGKPKLRRLFGTGAAIVFKGSGFYQTDYRSESYKAAAKADQDGAKAAAEKPAATTDTTSKNGAASSGTSGGSAKASAKTAKSGG